MGLRNNKVLKLLSILLFTFGLVAPVVASDSITSEDTQPGHKAVLPLSAHHSSLSQFLIEQTSGEEEREAKDKHQALPLVWFLPDTNVIDTLHAFRTDGYTSCPIQKMGTHPALFQLYRRFLI
jgi:hypothetical protein